MHHLILEYPTSGLRMLLRHLLRIGERVPWQIKGVAVTCWSNTQLCKTTSYCWKHTYSVPNANSLWHIYGCVVSYSGEWVFMTESMLTHVLLWFTVVSPTVCSPTSRVDSPTSYNSWFIYFYVWSHLDASHSIQFLKWDFVCWINQLNINRSFGVKLPLYL